MSFNQHINEDQLDILLKELALEENSVRPNEKEADFVLTQEFPVTIDPGKEKKLVKRLKNKGKNGGNFWLLVFGFLFLISCWMLWLNWNESGRSGSIIKTEKNTPSGGNENKNIIPDKNTVEQVKIKDTFGRPKQLNHEIKDTIRQVNGATGAKAPQASLETSVPFINDADIIKYRKIKEQMILKLVKRDKALYTHVPSDKTKYAGKEIIIDGFIIRNVGITNLEYKTFLADLLTQKRNEDYLMAEVKNNWTVYGYPWFAQVYFESEKYNDFPVVNITYEGATLFCKWLQSETEAYIRRNKLKEKVPLIRMPYDEEWIYAARDGYAKIAFEKGYNTIYDETEGLVDRSFTKRAELVKKRVRRADTMYTQFTTNHYGWYEKDLKEFFEKGFKYYPDETNDTIYTARMKVLGKIGRVSEMTGQRNGSGIWLTGLSWKSREDYLKMENEFKASLSSPFVGFRIVILDPDEPEYKNPFW